MSSRTLTGAVRDAEGSDGRDATRDHQPCSEGGGGLLVGFARSRASINSAKCSAKVASRDGRASFKSRSIMLTTHSASALRVKTHEPGAAFKQISPRRAAAFF